MHLVTMTASISRSGGGLFDAVRRMNQSIADRGHRVDVLALEDELSAEDLPTWHPIRPRLFPRQRLKKFAYNSQLTGELTRQVNRDSVCHLHGLWLYPSKAVRDVSVRHRIPRIISPHGMLDRWALQLSSFKKRLVGWAFEYDNIKTAHCLHALCEPERASIRAFGYKGPIAVIPNGVDLPVIREESFDPAPSDFKGRKVLLFLARLHPKKGLIPLIEGWKESTAAENGWGLVISGPDELGHRQTVADLISRLGVGDSVRLVGPAFGADKEAWLRRASAFVLTSFSEGFSMAVLEAMSYGLPVLLSPECNFPEARAEGCAFVASPTASAVAEGLKQLISLPDAERTAMGERGRQLVTNRYTWSRVAEQMEAVYLWLLGKRDVPTFVHQA